jgi:hypothetical protein
MKKKTILKGLLIQIKIQILQIKWAIQKNVSRSLRSSILSFHLILQEIKGHLKLN